ncbi:MAG TPA: 2TM domain-containing protein [Caulobacteraceae bacterium]|nr:2TM domain-containing protein [Caulobacteraceae bacterium]
MSCPTHETDLRLIAKRRVRARFSFPTHAFWYAAVNATLAVVNLATTPHSLWFHWSVLGWGVGLAAHAWEAYGPPPRSLQAEIDAEIERLRHAGAR